LAELTKLPRLSRRGFIKLAWNALLGGTAMGLGGAFYVTKVEPGWVQTTTQVLTLPRLQPAFNGYRLVQISDLHLETWMDAERLLDLVERVNQLEADLVVITGDFVTAIFENTVADLLASLSKLEARDGVVAVLGNHDHWTNANTIRSVLAASGIVELPNQVHTLRRGSAELHLAGVDDYMEDLARLPEVLAQLPPQGAAILLVHEPDFADISAASGRFDLQLSGHSHGGQVVIPFYGPPILPEFAKKYALGLYQVGAMQLYVNRGVGMIFPAVRFNCRPEISVITLQSGQAA